VFRIRRVYDDLLPVDRAAIAAVQAILAERFPAIPPAEVAAIPAKLRDPQQQLRSILFVAESGASRTVRGFALVLYIPDPRFCWLDFISVAPRLAGGGVGAALYARVREEAAALGCAGLAFECLPDDQALCRDKRLQADNRSRLRFYERFGARPVVNTAYETPVKPGGDCPPYLVLDLLGRPRLSKAAARKMVRAILERKYRNLCPPAYVNMVVRSFTDDPVRLRPPRYIKVEAAPAAPAPAKAGERIVLTVNDRHDIHHVHERGYVEAPVRVSAILRALEPTGLFERRPVRRFPEKHILAVHDRGFAAYLKKVCAGLSGNKSLYPYVFPVRNAARPPKELAVRAGYYCIDTFTPLNRNAYLAARRAVDCALTAAEAVLAGSRLAYALTRPPGHHAERRAFGGFCYFNSAAIAAHHLSGQGKVAVLDLDYHHGNGTQDIFYERDDVLTVSIHGHPSFAYPYFSGFADETGSGRGQGCNRNFPCAEHLDGPGYAVVLDKALALIRRFKPTFLVLALGLDPAKGDPTGTWSLAPTDFKANGRLVGQLGLPTLVVQEGGYRIPSLGMNARHFFLGLRETALNHTLPVPRSNHRNGRS
jgi:acetoin utilization deacetylase AcuC-like enzyme/GNAT superfamily N-acetyltransferase